MPRHEDGVSIAWAVAEYLSKKRATIFFVTQYPQLTRLAGIYPSVQNIHMDATIAGGHNGQISCTHKAKSGACRMESDYGDKLAAVCGWPSSLVVEAGQIENEVEALLPKDGP
jgi:DNA mismatch repair ATPase MutS